MLHVVGLFVFENTFYELVELTVFKVDQCLKVRLAHLLFHNLSVLGVRKHQRKGSEADHTGLLNELFVGCVQRDEETH